MCGGGGGVVGGGGGGVGGYAPRNVLRKIAALRLHLVGFGDIL